MWRRYKPLQGRSKKSKGVTEGTPPSNVLCAKDVNVLFTNEDCISRTVADQRALSEVEAMCMTTIAKLGSENNMEIEGKIQSPLRN